MRQIARLLLLVMLVGCGQDQQPATPGPSETPGAPAAPDARISTGNAPDAAQPPAGADRSQMEAVEAIRAMGGEIIFGEQVPFNSVSLSNTPVTDGDLEHFEHLSNLHYLHLDGTQVTDAGLVHLKGLTSLQVLNLANTQVTDAGVQELQEALPDCEIQR